MMGYDYNLKSITNVFSKIADEFKVDLNENDLNELVNVLSHYHQHAKRHNLNVTGMEPYKIVSWGGLNLCEKYKKIDEDKAKLILAVTIATLNKFLEQDINKAFKQDFIQKLFRMIRYECKEEYAFGIGKNGLYMIFKGIISI